MRAYNRNAWNKSVDEGNRWTQPVSADVVNLARQGKFEIVLTPTKPVPTNWFPKLGGMPTLCLASAGGQQAPLLAAAGAIVTVFDNSPRQLDQDRFVAERDGLTLDFVEGDMADLSVFRDDTFGLIFHPCSNAFVANVLPVWQECFRVLRPGGALLAGFTNAVRYIFDNEQMDCGKLEVRHAVPYSDLNHCHELYVKNMIHSQEALEFGHTLDDRIGGQLCSGFVLAGFYEDRYSEADNDPLSRYIPSFIATRAIKPGRSVI